MKINISSLPIIVSIVIFSITLTFLLIVQNSYTKNEVIAKSVKLHSNALLSEIEYIESVILKNNIPEVQNWVSRLSSREHNKQVFLLDPELNVLGAHKVAFEGKNIIDIDKTLFTEINFLKKPYLPINIIQDINNFEVKAILPFNFYKSNTKLQQTGWLYIKFNLKDAENIYNLILFQNSLAYMSSTFVIAICLFFLIKKTLMRRIKRIERGVVNYINGNTDIRIQTDFGSEFADLADLLNATFELVEFQKTIVSEEQKFSQQIIASIHDGIINVDPTGKIISCNLQAVNMFGYDQLDDLVESQLNKLIPVKNKVKHDSLFQHINSKGVQDDLLSIINELRHVAGLKKDGSTFPIEIAVTQSKLEHTIFYTAIVKDNTEQVKYRRSLEHIAYYDSLTSLYNLNGLKHYKNSIPNELTIFIIDIDGLSEYNHCYGFEFGDELLKLFSKKLQNLKLNNLLLAREKGGCFILLTTTDTNVSTTELKNLHHEEVEVEGINLNFSFCCCYTLLKPEQDFNEELTQCEIGLLQAKHLGRNSFIEVDVEWVKQRKYSAFLHQKLDDALKGVGLYFVYQPKYHAHNNTVASAEALIRWKLNDKVISPAVFVPLAEQSHLMPALDRFVIYQSCKTIRDWLDRGLSPVTISINLSARYLFEESTISYIFCNLGEFDIPPHLLEVEVTEYGLINDYKKTAINMMRLQKAGISIAIDDYGTGNSNLETVLSLPIQHLKIDQSFIKLGMKSKKGKAILKNILYLAQSLEVKTTAEGVETQEQLDYLAQAGCHYIQGYLLSKPLEIGDFEALLHTDKKNEA